MAKRKIVQDGDEILRKKCKPVTEFNEKLHVLLDDMLETMRAANGVGLAGSQVGILRRVAVVSVEPETVYDLVNPEILETEGEQEDVEGCLSFRVSGALSSAPIGSRSAPRTATGSGMRWRARGCWPGPSAMRSTIWMAMCSPKR